MVSALLAAPGSCGRWLERRGRWTLSRLSSGGYLVGMFVRVCVIVCVCVVLDKERPHDGPVWQGFRGYAELTVDLLTFIFVYLRLNVV